MVNLEEVKRKIRIVQLNLWVFFKWIIISIITQIMASNAGGTATLIGYPPNIMIGTATNLSFMDFISASFWRIVNSIYV